MPMNKYIKFTTDFASDVKKLAEKYSSHEFEWQFKQVILYAEGLFSLHPFKVGDVICLKKDMHDIPLGLPRHHFVKGAKFVVQSLDWEDAFIVNVTIPDEYIVSYGGGKVYVEPGVIYSGLNANLFVLDSTEIECSQGETCSNPKNSNSWTSLY